MSKVASAPSISPVFACPQGAEKRRAPRFRRNSDAQLLLWPAGPRTLPIDVKVSDYSSTGLGVVHDETLLIGQVYVVREPFVTDGTSCMYTVARSDRRPDGRFSIGLHKCNTLEDDLEPKEDHVTPPSRWVQVLFLLFSLVGAVTVVTVAILQRSPH
ncbi:MAG TPA: hypothetical protein VER17_10310 [Tepidisphaeraceae bacterium]|nr:hypothetical protein [Tepidisphaeraceae bacterium]